jgi:enoyl-CoA hydratase
MADAPVLTQRRDSVLLITLNRPEARNAINTKVAEGLAVALDELDAEDHLKVGVLTGAGRSFCAGMDLKAFVAGERPWVGDRGFAGIAQRASRKPLIAAVEGFAVAGGFEIALACDLLVAARNAKRMPYALAMELALTGDPIEAQRGYELGVVNRLTEPGQAVEAALELAERIAANGPLALAATKEVLQAQRDWSQDEFWERQRTIVEPVFASDDASEGATAFSEKRAPVWQGR